MAFTDRFVKHLKPRSAAYRMWERGSDPGFGVQITPSGAKTLFVGYRHEGKRRFYNCGTYRPGTNALAEARRRCREARKLIERGTCPQAHEAASKAAQARAHREQALRGSVKQLFDSYTAHLDIRGSGDTARKVRTIYQRDIAPVLTDTFKAQAVEPYHVKTILHNIIQRGAMIQANRVRSYLSAAFAFGIEHDNDPKNFRADVLFHLERSPVRDVPKSVKVEKPGERDLSTREIHHLWRRSAWCRSARRSRLKRFTCFPGMSIQRYTSRRCPSVTTRIRRSGS